MQIASCWNIRLDHPNCDTNQHQPYTVSCDQTLWHPEGALVLRWGRTTGYDWHGYIKTVVPRDLPASQVQSGP